MRGYLSMPGVAIVVPGATSRVRLWDSLSMVAARVRSVYDAQAKARMVEGAAKGGQSKGRENLPHPSEVRARDAAGKAVGVSGKSVDFATRVLTLGRFAGVPSQRLIERGSAEREFGTCSEFAFIVSQWVIERGSTERLSVNLAGS